MFSRKEKIVFLCVGGILVGLGIYGMWDYFPHAFNIARWEGRDALPWKLLFYLGCAVVIASVYSLWKDTKNIVKIGSDSN